MWKTQNLQRCLYRRRRKIDWTTRKRASEKLDNWIENGPIQSQEIYFLDTLIFMYSNFSNSFTYMTLLAQLFKTGSQPLRRHVFVPTADSSATVRWNVKLVTRSSIAVQDARTRIDDDIQTSAHSHSRTCCRIMIIIVL